MKSRASTSNCKKRRRYHSSKKVIVRTSNYLNADLVNLSIPKTPVNQIERCMYYRPMTAQRECRGRTVDMLQSKLFLSSTPVISKMPLKPIVFNSDAFYNQVTAAAAKAKRGMQVMLSNKKAYINRVEYLYESKRSQSIITMDRPKYEMPVNDLGIQGCRILLRCRIGIN